MSAGTLTLNNNSASVGGSGTAFATELTAGDFIVATVGGITYTLPVKSVVSDTSLMLISNYPGPTQSGVAWSAVPRAAQNQITAALVAQTTEALRGLNSDKQNWQAVFSDSGDITVILPDGSSFTGPSWKKISDLLAGLDPDELQQLADQVSTDAQQVATDRQDVDAKALQVSTDVTTASQAATNASSANTTAQQAKTDAVAANAAAQQAKTDAQAAAASVNPGNLLQKANNLSELVSTASDARANLAVYSTTETDNKVAAVSNKINYALISAGTVGISTRTVFTNPFGANVPVVVEAEIQIGSVWSRTGWICSFSSSATAYGVNASYVEGSGIVLQTANSFLWAYSSVSGGGHGVSSTGTSAPCRIHVWKVTA